MVFQIEIRCEIIESDNENRSVMSDSLWTTVHGIPQARILEWIAYPFSSRSSWPGIEPGPPALEVDCLPTELSGKRETIGSI